MCCAVLAEDFSETDVIRLATKASKRCLLVQRDQTGATQCSFCQQRFWSKGGLAVHKYVIGHVLE